jgi:hypothetical protein
MWGNIRMDLKEIEYEDVKYIHLYQTGTCGDRFIYDNKPSDFINGGKCVE